MKDYDYDDDNRFQVINRPINFHLHQQPLPVVNTVYKIRDA